MQWTLSAAATACILWIAPVQAERWRDAGGEFQVDLDSIVHNSIGHTYFKVSGTGDTRIVAMDCERRIFYPNVIHGDWTPVSTLPGSNGEELHAFVCSQPAREVPR